MQVEQSPNLDPEAVEKLKELYGQIMARDERRVLIDAIKPGTDLTPIAELAKKTKRVTTVTLHKPGEIAEVGGRRYQVQESGAWKRVS